MHILATNLAADSIRGHIKCSLTDTVSFSFFALFFFSDTFRPHTHIHRQTHTKLTNHLHANATLARTRPIGLCDEIRHATPRRAKPSRAEATSAAARCRSRCLLHCSTSAYPCLCPRLPASCLLPTTASASCLPLSCCLLLMMPTEMLGLPLLLIALLHLTISGLRFACQMSSCGGSTSLPLSSCCPVPPPIQFAPKIAKSFANCDSVCKLLLPVRRMSTASAFDCMHGRQGRGQREGGGGSRY